MDIVTLLKFLADWLFSESRHGWENGQGRPLPKFGEWDVNNPASAEGFTVIFNKARDEKKTKNSPEKVVSPRRTEPGYNKNDKNENYKHPPKGLDKMTGESYHIRGGDSLTNAWAF
ncbi:hypothetical protein H0E87_025700 [Populus deltoides]|uniref:RIN4 pathogenic type III effector avirulence factor Avr cleavage site domain-containing protein n=1 Tax=Populus deltoides TaxID=3696 RepID=A0A8T2X328_POPDE|nr:hypothetical protein H0E87_025700 [Populus deltoides]